MTVKVNNLTWLSTISSARILFLGHPPPMRNEISLPTIRKQGEMRVPRGVSAESVCSFPAGSLSLGRFSAPPIHQSPCCWALSLLRAAGLSPNVGWLMKALPVISHPPIPSSKSKLQATLKTKKGKEKKNEIVIPQNILWLHSVHSTVLHSITFIAVCASEPWRTFTTKSFISVSSLTSAIVETGITAAWILIKKKLLIIIYIHGWFLLILKGTLSCWSDDFFRLFDQFSYTLSVIKPENRLIELLDNLLVD